MDRPARSKLAYWLLLIPFIAVLWPPFYNSVEPRIFGFPFFYAYQLAWTVLAALLTGLVYFIVDHGANAEDASNADAFRGDAP